MTDTFELEKAIRQNGYSKKQVAKELGLTEQGFLLKLNNPQMRNHMLFHYPVY